MFARQVEALARPGDVVFLHDPQTAGLVNAVRATPEELTLILRAGFELRLGDDSDRALKLELARRILPSILAGGGYLDVSVPERPVASTTLESQVEVDSIASTSP